jgi:RHS repeat-associated protein
MQGTEVVRVNKNKISVSASGKNSKLFKITTAVLMALTALCWSFATAFAVDVDTSYLLNQVNGRYAYSVQNESNHPQFADKSAGNVVVDPLTGGLTFRETDLVLPGRDGFDLRLERYYNSALSEFYGKKAGVAPEFLYVVPQESYALHLSVRDNSDYSYHDEYYEFLDYNEMTVKKQAMLRLNELQTRFFYYVVGEGGEYVHESDGRPVLMPYYYTSDIERLNYQVQRNGIGVGWSWGFPSVQPVRNDHSNFGSEPIGIYFHTGNGGVYTVAEVSGTYKFLEAETEGYTFSVLRNPNNDAYIIGFAYTAPDGTKYTFGERGECKSMTDCHGNTITITYITSEIYYSGVRYTQISSITDTVGRVLSFTYYGKNTANPYFTVTVSYGGESFELKYVKQMVQGKKMVGNTAVNVSEEPVLMYFENQLGERTSYSGNLNSQNEIPGDDYNAYSFDSKRLDYCFDWQITPQYLLEKVWYPKSVISFNYELVKRNLGIDGVTEARRVSYYTESDIRLDGDYVYVGNSKGGADYPHYESDIDYTGYPAYASAEVMPNTAVVSGCVQKISGKLYSYYKNDTSNYQPFLYLYKEDFWANANDYNTLKVETEYSELDGKNPTLVTTTVIKGGQSYTTKSAREYWSGVSGKNGFLKSETRPLLASDYAYPYLRDLNKIDYDYYNGKLSSTSWYKDTGYSSGYEYVNYNSYKRPSVHSAKDAKTEYSYEYSSGATATSNKVTKRIITSLDGTSHSVRDLKTEEYYTSATNYAYPSKIREYYTDGDGDEAWRDTDFTYDMLLGQVKTVTDENGVTEYEYDLLGRVTKEISPVYEAYASVNSKSAYHFERETYYYSPMLTDYAYGGYSNVYTRAAESILYRYDASGNAAALSQSISYYDGLGNLVRERALDNVDGGSMWIYNNYYYNSSNLLIYTTDTYGNVTKTSYDSLNRPVSTVDFYGNSYITDYETAITATGTKSENYFTPNGTTLKQFLVENTEDIYGRTVEKRTYEGDKNSQPLLEKYSYDLVGNLTGYTDPNNNLNSDGVTVKYAYNSANRLTSTKNAKNETSSVSYDGRGNVTGSTVGGQRQFTKQYNERGQITDDKDQLNNFQYYRYDALGRLSSHTDRKGVETSFTYDALNNISSSEAMSASNGTEYRNVITTPFGASATWDLWWRKSGNNWIGSIYGITERGFSPTGKLITNRAQQPNYDAYARQYSNALGQITQKFTGYIDGGSVYGIAANYSYDKTRLDKVQLDGNITKNTSDAVNAKYEYYSNGSLKSVSYPPLSNGKILKTAYVYDGFNRLISVTNAIGTAAEHTAGTAAVISKYEYLEYDNNGNVKKIRETTAEGIDKLTVLCYDSLNRLISAETADGKIETYAYDNKGNRIAQNTNEILFEDGSVEYTYDEQNRLMSISKTDGNGDETVTNNDYTADGLRYLKVVDGTPTFYIYDPQGRVTNELDDTDSISASYIWGNDRALAQIDAYDDTYFYLYNGHGDVTQIIDQAGEIVNSYSYDVWGNFEVKNESVHNPFTYSGQQYDESTGLYYLRNRHYDPKTGQFIQEDPARDGQNWYQYGSANPVTYIDISGLKALPYRPGWWNNGYTNDPQGNTNCYAYALNFRGTITYGKGAFQYHFTIGVLLQPGEIAGYNTAKDEYRLFYKNSRLIDPYQVAYYAEQDAIANGHTFKKYNLGDSIGQGEWVVALYYTTGDSSTLYNSYDENGNIYEHYYYVTDYHWARENEDGTWSHKPGNTEVTNLDADYNIIKDPSTANMNYRELKGYHKDTGLPVYAYTNYIYYGWYVVGSNNGVSPDY